MKYLYGGGHDPFSETSFLSGLRKIFSFLLIFLLCVFHAKGQDPAAYLLLTDDTQSSIFGAHNLLSFHRLIYGFENSYLKTSWVEENTLLNKVFGISYRLVKTVFLDNVADYFVFLCQHEVFGHGARYREFGYTNNSFSLHLIFPYGDAKGWARQGGGDGTRITSVHERLTMTGGGSEANAVLSNVLRTNWLQRERINYRESILYLFSASDLSAYILRTEYGMKSHAMNDVLHYLNLINANYGYYGEGDYRLKLDELSRYAWIGLLNPFFFYSLYCYFVDYLWSGGEEMPVPMIKIGSMKYLPALRVALTPFGPEIYFENFIRTGGKLIGIYLRHGKPTFERFWGGGISAGDFLFADRLKISGRLDVWHQPALLIGGEALKESHGGWGGAMTATLVYPLVKSHSPFNIVAQLGYKTAGFIQGEKLSPGFVLRLGLGFAEK